MISVFNAHLVILELGGQTNMFDREECFDYFLHSSA